MMAIALPTPAEFIAFAAGVFAVDPAKLTLSTEIGSFPEWDSVNHLRLVLEAEARFGVRYSFECIPEMRHLGDFLKASNLSQ